MKQCQLPPTHEHLVSHIFRHANWTVDAVDTDISAIVPVQVVSAAEDWQSREAREFRYAVYLIQARAVDAPYQQQWIATGGLD